MYRVIFSPEAQKDVIQLKKKAPQAPQYKAINVEDEDGEVRIIATLKRVLN